METATFSSRANFKSSPAERLGLGHRHPGVGLSGPDAEEHIPVVQAVEPGFVETSTVWCELIFISARLAATF
jgi:hypothetical protein